MIYTPSHLSLAVLEILAHTDPDVFPADFAAFELEIPDDHISIEEVQPSALPNDWSNTPYPPACQEIGVRWAVSVRTLLLAVPSAIVPEETNYLINPSHPDHKFVRIATTRPFVFDLRLLRA